MNLQKTTHCNRASGTILFSDEFCLQLCPEENRDMSLEVLGSEGRDLP